MQRTLGAAIGDVDGQGFLAARRRFNWVDALCFDPAIFGLVDQRLLAVWCSHYARFYGHRWRVAVGATPPKGGGSNPGGIRGVEGTGVGTGLEWGLEDTLSPGWNGGWKGVGTLIQPPPDANGACSVARSERSVFCPRAAGSPSRP